MTRASSHSQKKIWISIVKAKDCLFSRRLGHTGKIIFGYSVIIRIFGKHLIGPNK